MKQVDRMKCGILLNVPVGPKADFPAGAELLPRKDYWLLSEHLNAQIINRVHPYPDEAATKHPLAFWMAQAWNAFQRRDEYDVILSMSEQVGLWLALFLRAARCKKPHVMISHYLTPRRKNFFLRRLGMDSYITKFVCYGSLHSDFLINELHIPPEKVEVVLHPVDARFWHPMPVSVQRLVSSAGLTGRDYPTLERAVADIDVDVVVAAYSPWTKNHGGKLPGNATGRVNTVQCTPVELRDLYARSLFVVVPLLAYNSTAGALVIYEAMAMGKAVVTTRNGGQADIVEEGVTGYYTPLGDAAALRDVITHLLDNPDVAERMGAKARQVVEKGLNLDVYAQRMDSIVREAYRQGVDKAGRV